MNMSIDYAPFFASVTGQQPHPWQLGLGAAGECEDRLLRIPTGFGKTAGVVLPWLYHRVANANRQWPTRLLFVLPMRVLAEQTVTAVREWVVKAGLSDTVGVHLAMGGVDAGDFHLHPERPTVLVGTQDMWLSRALMRGFASGRARWPVDFGLVHHDTLWVLDEVQLMDVGLATTAQLAAHRARQPTLRPAYSWWMSATLQPSWLATVDARARTAQLAERVISIPAEARTGPLFDVKKSLARREDVSTPEEVAKLAHEAHVATSTTRGEPTLTLVIVNTVDRASTIAAELEARFVASTGSGKSKARSRRPDAPEVRLVHSRFRGHERAQWDFLTRAKCDPSALPPHGRIVIATQVVEAGVDVSAATLVTDLAPWPSLVQRFGRCARYAGQTGNVVVIGSAAGKSADKLAGPYEVEDLDAASRTLVTLGEDAAPRAIEALEESLSGETRAGLYRYEPFHVLRRADLEDLFDTSKDLSGGDVDPSRFIRSGEERDVTLLWRAVEPAAETVLDAAATDEEADEQPASDATSDSQPLASRARRRHRALELREQPLAERDELCRVRLTDAREWLSARERFWVFDYIDGAWRPGTKSLARRVTPGDTVLVDSHEGGYTTDRGFDAKSAAPVSPVPRRGESSRVAGAFDRTASSEGSDALSELGWQTIATHGREVGAEVESLAQELGLDARWTMLLALAGRWHDVGKAHDTFQRAIRTDAPGRPLRTDLAKAPTEAWRRPAYPERPGFRHELASMLALYATVARAKPDHPAFANELAAALRVQAAAPPAPIDEEVAHVGAEHPLAAELIALDAHELDLVAWCVLTHHGKVRCSLASTPSDQELRPEDERIHGVRSNDVLPATLMATAGGNVELPATTLDLELARLGLSARFGHSWGERVAALRTRHGPFVLAYLEAMLRAADVRASIRATTDALLSGEALPPGATR